MKVLITGASSGMGYDMAKYLSTYNFDLFLVAKDKKELDKKFKDLKNKIKTYGFDLSKEEEYIKLYKEVRNENIDILINNAGFGDLAELHFLHFDKIADLAVFADLGARTKVRVRAHVDVRGDDGLI